MSGMVFRMVPTIGKDALRDIIMGMGIVRGNDSSRDNREEGNAGQEQRGKHGGNGADKEP
jgi:hypothetical protein